MTGPGSTWNAGGDLNIGLPFGTGTVTIADGGVLNVAGTANIGAGNTLNVGTGGLAGTLNAPTIVNDGQIVANFTNASTLAAAIAGAGTLTKLGPGR